MGGWSRRVFIAIALALSLLVSTEAASSSRATAPRKALKPSIYVKTPTNGSKISGRVVWKAGYTGQTPKRVEFNIDGVKRWTDRRAPFRFKGDTGYLDAPALTVGTHTLTVIAFRGNRSQSSSWLVRAAVFARSSASTRASASRTTRKAKAKITVQVAAAPANTALPTASGTPVVGQTLTASNGSWTGSQPITYAYAWLRCSNTSDAATCSSIAQATASSYLVTSADTGYYLRAKVTATNSVASASALSAATVQVTGPPSDRASGTLTATSLDNSHIQLSWGSVDGASNYEVYRGTRLVKRTSQTSAVDRMLWPQTSYSYTVNAVSPSGAVLASLSASATTTQLPQGGFSRPFPSDSVWNTPVGNAQPVSNSSSLVSFFLANTVHPNMTLRTWGVSVAEADSSDPLYSVPCVEYTRCTLGAFGQVPIPLTATPDLEEDGHMVVYDPAAQREWGMWQAKTLNGAWTAGAGEAVSTNSGNGVAPAGTVGSNAANFPLLAGIVRPEEILQGHIDHALVFSSPKVSSAGHVCPATHNDGFSSDPNALREGMRLQLDPTLDVDALNIPAWQKTIAKAVQVYGMYVKDQGGTFGIHAENPISRGYDAWAKVGFDTSLTSASLSGIPWERLRVVAAPC